MPNTSSPEANLVTAGPTATTVPATSRPGTLFRGPRSPKPSSRIRYGWPAITCQVPRSTPAARTWMRTSSSPMSGLVTWSSRITSSGTVPYRLCVIARIVAGPAAGTGFACWASCVVFIASPSDFIASPLTYTVSTVGLRCK